MRDLAATWTEKLLEVTSAFSRARTAREVGDVAVRLGVEALGASCGSLCLLSQDGGELYFVSSVGVPAVERERFGRVPVQVCCPACDAVRARAPLFLDEVEEARRRYPDAPPEASWLQGSGIGVPLVAGDRVLGYLGFGFRAWIPIGPDARAFAQALAAQGTQALERARLLDLEHQARRRLKVIADASEAFGAPTLSSSAVLDAFAQKVASALGDICVVRLLSPGGEALEARALWAGDRQTREELARIIHALRRPGDDPLVRRVVATGEVVVAGPLDPELLGASAAPELRAWLVRNPVQAFLAAPLRMKERVVGVVTVVRTRPHEPYGDQDRLLVEALSARASSALEKTRLYEEVLRSQRLFEGIADASPDLLYLVDVRRGRNVYVSKSSEHVLGRTPREIAALGERFLEELVHPDDLPRLRAQNARFAALPEGAMVDHEYRMRHADGSWRWMRSRDRVFSRTPLGDPELILGVARDVTEHVRTEQERELLLAREQAARREAETASRAKDEFLAMLGHELRNPLSPMITALELMRLRAPDVLVRERTTIERQVQHLVRLVDDLLDVSRITRGKIELKKRPLEISEAVAAAVEMASPLLESRRHRLELDVPRAGLGVEGDPARLAQVLANLLTNAAKYTEPGGVVAVRAREEDGEAVIRVKDSGIGIPPELLTRVFDLFVQSERALDRSQGGLGLGLAIVRSMVAMHGGTVTAASEGPGLGSEFTVRLPLSLAPTHAVRVEPRGPALRRDSSAARRRVLVVDDNQDAADALVEALDASGHSAAAAYDGPSALDAAARVRPDAAFLDIGLPVMDGYELARRIRDLLGPDVKLVALTGYGQEHDRMLSREAGFDEHLVKPIDLERIERLLVDLVPGYGEPEARAEPA